MPLLDVLDISLPLGELTLPGDDADSVAPLLLAPFVAAAAIEALVGGEADADDDALSAALAVRSVGPEAAGSDEPAFAGGDSVAALLLTSGEEVGGKTTVVVGRLQAARLAAMAIASALLSSIFDMMISSSM